MSRNINDVSGLYTLSKVADNIKFENMCTQYTEKEANIKSREANIIKENKIGYQDERCKSSEFINAYYSLLFT